LIWVILRKRRFCRLCEYDGQTVKKCIVRKVFSRNVINNKYFSAICPWYNYFACFKFVYPKLFIKKSNAFKSLILKDKTQANGSRQCKLSSRMPVYRLIYNSCRSTSTTSNTTIIKNNCIYTSNILQTMNQQSVLLP